MTPLNSTFPNDSTATSCPHSIWNKERHEAGYGTDWPVVFDREGRGIQWL